MVFFTKGWRRAFIVTLAVSAFSLSLVTSAVAAITLNGSGATFPKPLYDRYFSQMRSANQITVNYEATGSGAGIKALVAGTVDFAGSDALMSAEQIGQVKRGVIAVPTAGGAVAVIYNLPGVNDVRLNSDAMKGIFEGKITRWNDAKIAGIAGQACHRAGADRFRQKSLNGTTIGKTSVRSRNDDYPLFTKVQARSPPWRESAPAQTTQVGVT